MNTTGDPVQSLLDQASHIVASSGTAQASQMLQHAYQQVDQFTQYGLLPLCLALFIVHEHYRSVEGSSPFRMTHVLARTVAIVCLVLVYGKVCHLITSVAGVGSGWMTSNNYLALYDNGSDSLGAAWDAWGGFLNIPKFVGMVIIWLILLLSVLFAYVAAAFLSIVQAVTLSILLGLGKTCIVVSLVPGVGLGKSWARALAQVAAWSTVAGVITSLLGSQNIVIGQLMVAGEFVPLLKAAAHFIILAFLTLSVPLITAKLFSGGAAGLTEVLPGYFAAKAVTTGALQRLQGLRSRDDSAFKGGSGSSTQRTRETRESMRVHKIPFVPPPGGGEPARRPRPSGAGGPVDPTRRGPSAPPSGSSPQTAARSVATRPEIPRPKPTVRSAATPIPTPAPDGEVEP